MLLSTAVCVGTVSAASGADLYIAPVGVDSGDCRSVAIPCGSFDYVQVVAASSPGHDTVHLAAGDYGMEGNTTNHVFVPDVTWAGPQAGVPADEQSGDTARIRAAEWESGMHVAGDGIVIDGLTFDAIDGADNEGSFGIYASSAVTVRNAVFTHVRTGIWGNDGVDVSRTSFDTSGDGMYLAGAAPSTVSHSRFNPSDRFGGVGAEGGPLTITDSSFEGGYNGVWMYAGEGPVTVHRNRFSPSLPEAMYVDGATVDASDNWWGCNEGPDHPDCTKVVRAGSASVTTAPWLQLRASTQARPDDGRSAVVTVGLDRNSAGETVPVDFQPGSSVGFTTTAGTLDRTSAPLSGGQADVTLTLPGDVDAAYVSAALDNETVRALFDVDGPRPTVAVVGDVTAGRSGTAVAVTGVGQPGFPLQVNVNGVAAGLPVTVDSEGVWSTSFALGGGDNVIEVVQGIYTAHGPTVVGVYPPGVSSPGADERVRDQPTVVGTAIPGATIEATDEHGTVVGSGSAAPSGDFSFVLDPLDLGPRRLDLTQTAEGVTSEVTSVDVLVAPIPTVDVDRSEAMMGETVHLRGTGLPGGSLQIRINGTPVETATVGLDGDWTFDLAIGEGTNDIDVVQDGAETSSTVTVHGRSAPVVERPVANALVRATFRIYGLGFANTDLLVTDELGTEIGRTFVPACGCWDLETTVRLDPGPHTLTISQTVDGTVRSTTRDVIVDRYGLELTSPTELEPVPAEGLRVTGSAAPGATIKVYVAPDNVTPAATGVVEPDGTFDVPVTIAPGSARIGVTQTPVDGVESEMVRMGLTLLLNPPTVTVDGPTAVAAGDPIALAGTARPGASVELVVNDEPVDDAVVADSEGVWTASVPSVVGDNAITATQTTHGSNPAFSLASDPVRVTGVGAPVVTSPTAGEHVLAMFDVAGTALPGATVTINEGETVLATTTADATTGAWATTTTVSLDYGDRTIAVRQRFDGATGVAGLRAVTVVPAAPVLTHPDGVEVGDMGILVEGTADPSAAVDVFLDGSSTAVASITADGDGDFGTTLPVAPGMHSVRVSQRVGDSLSGPLSASRSTLVLPGPPTLRLGSDATVTAGAPISVSGRAEPGATVVIRREASDGTATTFTAIADGFGAWSRTLPAASRTNTITARQQLSGFDVASRPSAPVVVTAAPALRPPTFTVPAYARSGGLTVTGTAAPGATVTGTFGGTSVTTTADGTGAWSVAVTVGAGPQEAIFGQAAEVDGTAEVSDDSDPQTVTGVAPPTVSSPSADAVVAATPTVTGSALPGASVSIRNGSGAELATVTADGVGDFSAPIALPAIGRYALTVSQTRGGVTSDVTVVAVRFPPVAPTLQASHGFVTGAVRLTGTALANAAIKIYDRSGSTHVASGSADAAGNYEIAVTREAGAYEYTATQSVDGNESARSAARNVTVWPTALTITAVAPVVGVGTPASVSGAAVPGATVSVSAGSTILATSMANGAGRWAASVSVPPGRHRLGAVQRVGADDGEPVSGPTVTALPAPTVAPVSGPIDSTLSLSGSALDAVTVVIVDETGRELGTTISDRDGAWSLTTGVPMAPGDHTLVALARLGGVDGPPSPGMAVTVRAPVTAPEDNGPGTPDQGGVGPGGSVPEGSAPTPPTGTTPRAPAPFSVSKPTVKKKTTIVLGLKLPDAGRVTVKASARVKVKGKRRTVVYAPARSSVATAGARRLQLKPSRRAKALLDRQRSVTVKIVVTFTPTNGRRTSKTVTVKVRGGL